MPRLFLPIGERFWDKVNKHGPTARLDLDACWLWVGAVSGNGYGAVSFEGKQEGAHRVAWMLVNGEIPEGMQVLHECDTPLCVRHLFLGTCKDNAEDMVRKGRSASGDRNPSRLYPERYPKGDAHYLRVNPKKILRGEKHGRSKLIESDVRAIRARHILAAPKNSAIAKDYGVTTALIRFIVRGEIWSHVA